ncbi:acyl-CoA dehydrogenase family protein [Niveispirillum sp.]|uniref:acyl-CoA dehydrogenase family protein n=1 Tax=Niveispirillum sp. TaxID=1917217 RepID=UPI001B43B033|nr:acyl-CoA dehydrogenase family protein [Niveispirillum sp.]MBP7337096.1 acyl-CoA dehydrogenase family protein [Niveispirillum sp.]
MRRLIFQPEHDQFRESARRFFQKEVAPHGERWRAQGHVDREIYKKAGEAGLLLTWAEERFGGAGISDFRFEQIIIEENIIHGEIGFYINLHSNLVAPYIDALGTPAQRERILPGCVSGDTILAIAMTEPGAGSDLAGMRTRAEDKGDHWLLNGAKTYISNGFLADLIIVAARTQPDQKHGLGLFLVEAGMPGFDRGQRLKKMGLHAQDTSELFFNDVKLPKENVLGDPTSGFRYLTRFLAKERLVAAIGSLAAAQVAFDITLDYVRERRAFGRPIGAFQHNRFVLAGLRAELDAVQTLIDQCVLLLNDGELSGEDAAECKLLATELEGRMVDAGVQMHGGAGYMEEYRISRLYTDARVSRIFAGSSEIMKEIIGRGLGLDERKMG